MLKPLFITIYAYLFCVFSFLLSLCLYANFGINIPKGWVVLCWIVGISIHFYASFLYSRSSAKVWLKVLYLILPLPLAFVVTAIAVIAATDAWKYLL